MGWMCYKVRALVDRIVNNALTNGIQTMTVNYLFSGLNIEIVAVPNIKLSKLAEMARYKKIISVQIEFVDITDHTKEEGLGNKFLSHI